jgi:hypothetical protein
MHQPVTNSASPTEVNIPHSPKKIPPNSSPLPQRSSAAHPYSLLSTFSLFHYDVATTKLDDWVVMTRPAMEADVRVAKTPAMSAENAKREISPPRLGAN